MKILEKPNKHVNFVDENNTFVGYDLEQDCCEDAGWFIAEEKNSDLPEIEDRPGSFPDISKYFFDIEYFEKFENETLDEGSMVVFRLVSKGMMDLYLHIFNAHNGYYSHGFEAKVAGEVWKDGCI